MIQNIENNLSVLQNVTKADVRLEPFPHIVIKDALPKALFEKLYSTMPHQKASLSAIVLITALKR